MQYVIDHVIDMGGKAQKFSDIAEIENLDYPPEVDPGQQFGVSYQAHNLSNATQILWGEIWNTDTNTVIPDSSWQVEVPADLIYNSDVVIPEIQEDLHGQVVIGHVEMEPPAPPDIWKIATAIFGLGMIGMVGFVMTRPAYPEPRIERLKEVA